MPLPSNGALSLQAHSQPGDTTQSKPKQAMIVRMSAETLEALEAFPNQPQMSFEFGENPGIYIGESYFSMRPLKESSPHEVFLRASSAAKPMAPLKLYANVTGKFTVERQLGEKVQDKVRNRTLAAEKQRSETKAVFLDAPLSLPPTNGKKRKPHILPSMFPKKISQADHLRNASSSSIAPTRVASPLPQPHSSKGVSVPTRKRLIHCLAVAPRLEDEAVRLVGGSDCEAGVRQELIDLIHEIAEQTPAKKGDKTPRTWCLKGHTWLEVRPFEWPKLTEDERTKMARRARYAFESLKIPPSDPAWEHVRWQKPTGSAPAPAAMGATSRNASGSNQSGTSKVTVDTKRGVSSQEVKEKKVAKAAAKAKADIKMKDERARAPRPSLKEAGAPPPVAAKVSASVDAAPAPKPAARRLPGSGFKMSKTASLDSRSDSVESSQRKSGVSVDARPRDSLPASLPPKPSLQIPPIAGDRKASATSPSKHTKKVREQPGQESDRDREKEKIRDKEAERERKRERDRILERERDREKNRGKERDRDRDRDRDKDRDAPAAGVKRKKPARDADEEALEDAILNGTEKKRRKTEEGQLSIPAKDQRVRDLSLPKKPVPQRDVSPLPRAKIQKGHSPLPPARHPLPPPTKAPTPNLVPPKESPKPKGASSKSRRRSPIYTSSDDDKGQIPRPTKREPPPAAPPSNNIAKPRPRLPVPLPSDHASLRARYTSSYEDYIHTFQKIVTQKRKIETMLNGGMADSDGDIDILDADELARLRADHNALRDELQHIQQIFAKTGKGGSGSASD